MTVWVKICGITRPEDAEAAFEAGVDAIGLNFVGGPRRITVGAAREILAEVPQGRLVVALAALGPEGVEPPLEELFEAYAIRHVQVYGNVSSENIRRLAVQGRRSLVVCRLAGHGLQAHGLEARATAESHLLPRDGEKAGPEGGDVRRAIEGALAGLATDDLFAVLLDARVPGKQGGTGIILDWHAIAQARGRGELEGLPPLILAGGLDPDNISRAVALVRPWGVDVSSGVETRPGRKNRTAVADFVAAVKSSER
ncbi:MAG: phosphoribosylanthranilate isomerase [Planctomycetota bacterium]